MPVNKDWANSCYDREWRILNVVTELSLLALTSGFTLCKRSSIPKLQARDRGVGSNKAFTPKRGAEESRDPKIQRRAPGHSKTEIWQRSCSSLYLG